MLRLLSRLAILVSLCVVFFLTPASASARLVLYKVLSRQLLLKLLSLFVFLSLILLIKTHTAYAETSSSFRFQNYVQSINVVNPDNILNTSGPGASTSCLTFLCWSIRISNPNVSGIPDDAIITGARFVILGTGSGGYLQVLMGKNSTYCLRSIFVGDRSSVPRETNGALTNGSAAFFGCRSADGFPSTVSELPNFFLEITAPKSFTPILPFAFINPLVAFDYILPVTPTPTPTLTSTPTPTQTPTPTPPEPFLELPYDYQSQGKSFEQVAFDPFSWFDHEYPLQNFCCDPPVLNYTGELKNTFYRSHSGYDYSSTNGVVLNTPVLAAASGWATFTLESQSGGAGNMIKIDHENGYQTWYEHLANDGLVISDTEGRIFVNKGQPIGKVGMTGNTTGPHIHFSVFKDANNNGAFSDDYPWGLVDPLGWEGESPDPWTEWESGGRRGSQSYNLFIARQPPKQQEIPSTGGTISIEDIILDILSGTFDEEVKIIMEYGPFDSASEVIKSAMPSVFLNAVDSFGQKVTEFLQPVTITYDYANADLLNMKEDSLKIYWFNEQTNLWEPLTSTVDIANKKVSTQTTHFSQFALMGEVKDLIAPETEVIVNGDKGQDQWYRSDVTVELLGHDNEGGIGLQYTLYTLNGSDWFEYSDPIVFSSEGAHTLTYQSFDKADNKGERRSVNFIIDKTIPEARVYIDPVQQDIVVVGIDDHLSGILKSENTNTKQKDDAIYTVSDLAGNTLRLDMRDRDKQKKDTFSLYALQYNQLDSFQQPKNLYTFTYVQDKDTLTVEEEDFSIHGEIKIRIKYDNKKDQSTITTREAGEEKIKEIRNGLVLLQLITERGTLMYSY